MGYVRTGGMSTAARRRRRRTALVLSALVLVLVLIFGYAVAYYQGWIVSEGGPVADPSATTATATATPEPPAADEITVNVYNANGAPGLAADTAEAMSIRGYAVDQIADDPEDAQIDGVADIRHGPEGAEAALVVQQEVPGSELLLDEREGADVDLVVGDAWEALPEAEDAAETDDDEG